MRGYLLLKDSQLYLDLVELSIGQYQDRCL